MCVCLCVCSEELLEDEKVFEVLSELDNERGMSGMYLYMFVVVVRVGTSEAC